jgi:hypothetical protein
MKGNFSKYGYLITIVGLGLTITYIYTMVGANNTYSKVDIMILIPLLLIGISGLFLAFYDFTKKEGQPFPWKKYGFVVFALVLLGVWKVVVN